jgi:sirohydrochlorin cobaltochelatase
MAGGPPHKGALLEPGRREEIGAQASHYADVVDEICRGIAMVTGLSAEPSAMVGWIRVDCTSAGMAGWLVRAIVMENVSARVERLALYLPAGPQYRLEKEIKNVVTTMAKTCHYWFGHTSLAQRRAITNLFAKMELESPLIQPAILDSGFPVERQQRLAAELARSIQEATGIQSSSHKYASWLGLDCRDIRAAIWMMRALVASNVLSRREGTVVFVAINPDSDRHGETVLQSVVRTHRLGVARNIFK